MSVIKDIFSVKKDVFSALSGDAIATVYISKLVAIALFSL